MPGPPRSAGVPLLRDDELKRKKNLREGTQGDAKTPDVALGGQSSCSAFLESQI